MVRLTIRTFPLGSVPREQRGIKQEYTPIIYEKVKNLKSAYSIIPYPSYVACRIPIEHDEPLITNSIFSTNGLNTIPMVLLMPPSPYLNRDSCSPSVHINKINLPFDETLCLCYLAHPQQPKARSTLGHQNETYRFHTCGARCAWRSGNRADPLGAAAGGQR